MEFNLWETLIAIINFLILLFILRFVLFKPLNKTLQARRTKIQDNIDAAEKLKAEMEAMHAEIQTERANAKQTAQEIIGRAEKAGEAAKDDIIAEARNEADKIISKAKLEIEEEKSRALAAIRGEAADLALLAAGKLLGRSLDDQDHRSLVTKYTEEAGKIQ